MATRAHEPLRRRAGARPERRRGARAFGRLPAAALVCALVAFLNAAAWSLLTPPFQVPDEQSHYAYSEFVAQHVRPPIPDPIDGYSD
jgi:hypothetical protein